MHNRYMTMALAPALLASTMLAQTAFAQAADEESSGIQDIIVTARKTTENLQTTPVAVSAFTAETLEKQSIIGINQLATTTPNLSISSAVAQPGSATLFIRGQGSSDGLIAIDQAVGAYFNGVYLARSTGGAFDMVDVQRVEVLRGPQGTLFGRNTTGGAINVIPNEPTGDLAGAFRVEYGNYQSLLVRAMANVPLAGDDIALRVAGQHRQREGYGRNLTNGRDLNDANSDYVRAMLKIAPGGSGLSALLTFDYSKFTNGGELVGLRSIGPSSPYAPSVATRDLLVNGCNGTGPTGAIQPLCHPAARGPISDYVYGAPGSKVGFYDVYHNANSYGKSESWGASGVLTWDVADALQIKSTTAWRSVRLDSLSDNDGTPFHFTGGMNGSFGNRIGQDQFSQEMQLSGKLGMVDYILGGFYFVENGTDVSRSGSLFPLSTAISWSDGTVRNQSLAGYGQLIFHLTDSLRVTGGLRYTEDKRRLVSRNRNEAFTTGAFTPNVPAHLLDGDPNDPFRATLNRTYNYWSWLGAVDWQATNDLFFYGKVSRSQRSGGFNTRIAAVAPPPVSFLPEVVTDYEAGAKMDLLDRRVRLNLAVFNSEIDNLQRNIIGTVGTQLISGADNAAKARIRGLEAELIVAPAEGLTLSGNFGLTDAKYKRFINSIDLSNWSGAEFPYTSKYTFSISGDYEHPIGDAATLSLHVDYGWRSKQYAAPMQLPVPNRAGLTPAQIEEGNRLLQETSRINSYGLLNARIAFRLDDPGIELAFYGRNITKKKYITRLLSLENTPFGLTSYMPGDPRTYGASMSFKF